MKRNPNYTRYPGNKTMTKNQKSWESAYKKCKNSKEQYEMLLNLFGGRKCLKKY